MKPNHEPQHSLAPIELGPVRVRALAVKAQRRADAEQFVAAGVVRVIRLLNLPGDQRILAVLARGCNTLYRAR